jgi:SPX domain protein involved in polyphosphate accumulation
VLPDKFEEVNKKISRELEMEERTCHEESMGQLDEIINEEMFPGDKSLKSALIKGRKMEEAKKEKSEKFNSSFEENRNIIEEFPRPILRKCYGTKKCYLKLKIL